MCNSTFSLTYGGRIESKSFSIKKMYLKEFQLLQDSISPRSPLTLLFKL